MEVSFLYLLWDWIDIQFQFVASKKYHCMLQKEKKKGKRFSSKHYTHLWDLCSRFSLSKS